MGGWSFIQFLHFILLRTIGWRSCVFGTLLNFDLLLDLFHECCIISFACTPSVPMTFKLFSPFGVICSKQFSPYYTLVHCSHIVGCWVCSVCCRFYFQYKFYNGQVNYYTYCILVTVDIVHSTLPYPALRNPVTSLYRATFWQCRHVKHGADVHRKAYAWWRARGRMYMDNVHACMYACTCMRFTLHSELRAYPSYGHPLRRRCPDKGGLSVTPLLACNLQLKCSVWSFRVCMHRFSLCLYPLG